MNLQNLLECANSIKQEQVDYLKFLINQHKTIIILGNGGSSAIASHISQDYSKQLKKKSFTFSDSSRLTCYINDYGMETAYRQFLSEFTEQDSLVILISSSGESKNILNCAKYCNENKINYIILTGFLENNSLRVSYKENSLIDFWVNSTDYGIVECVHQIFLHTPA